MKNKLIISILFIILSGCHKEDSQETTNYIYVNQELKSQAFKIGSYWIYQNDSTSKTDCTFITSFIPHFDRQNAGMGFSYLIECYEMYYSYHYTSKGYSHYWDRMFENRIIHNPTYCDWDGLAFCGPLIYALDSFPGKINYDSLKVGNNEFYKVQKASIDSIFWFTARSIGVVKKVVHDSIDKGTWNLLRWKIVK